MQCVCCSDIRFLTPSFPTSLLARYEWNGKVQHIKTRSSKFSRLADKPGTFAITSISHAKNQCKVEVNDIVRRIHALPSATISEGKTFVETVEEGQFILFTFGSVSWFSSMPFSQVRGWDATRLTS
jgi:hypothetical protein